MKSTISFIAVAILAVVACHAIVQAEDQPQAKATIKGPWADAKVGMIVKFKVMIGDKESTMTQEVVKADDQSVTIHRILGDNKDKADEKVEKRFYTQDEINKRLEKLGKKGDDETIKIMGKDLKCEVYTMQMSDNGKTVSMKTYVNREMPGWAVRTDNDKSGKMSVFMELAEVKN